MKRGLAVVLGVVASAPIAAQTRVDICYNWSCERAFPVVLDDAVLARARARLASAEDAAAERARLSEVVAALYRHAGRRAPFRTDRAGNWLDQDLEGRMDCIDHSISTTRLLTLLQARGGLRFHRVIEPVWRGYYIIDQHRSAAIEELAPPPPALAMATASEALAPEAEVLNAPAPPLGTVQGATSARFVVDSWLVDHGKPAVVLPLENWMKGEGPNVR